MFPINWRGKTPPWMYLVLAAIFAINAVIWALVALHQGGVGLPAASALVWTIGAALWVLAYFRRRRRPS